MKFVHDSENSLETLMLLYPYVCMYSNKLGSILCVFKDAPGILFLFYIIDSEIEFMNRERKLCQEGRDWLIWFASVSLERKKKQTITMSNASKRKQRRHGTTRVLATLLYVS